MFCFLKAQPVKRARNWGDSFGDRWQKTIPCPRGNKQSGPLPLSGWPDPRSHHCTPGVDGPRKLPCHPEADYQQAHHPWLILTMVAQPVKNLPATQETRSGSLSGRSLEKEMATHSRILAWRIPWTEEPGRRQSVGPQEWDTTERINHLHTHHRKPGTGQALFTY